MYTAVFGVDSGAPCLYSITMTSIAPDAVVAICCGCSLLTAYTSTHSTVSTPAAEAGALIGPHSGLHVPAPWDRYVLNE